MIKSNSHQTPIDDGYASCLETRASLLIYPGTMSPAEVTTRLGLSPSQTSVRGEEIVNSLGRRRVVKNNIWILSTEGEIASLDLRRHLDWLLGKLATRSAELIELQSVDGLLMTVRCVWHSRSGHGGPVLWPEQMRVLADLNLECSFDVYFFPSDDT